MTWVLCISSTYTWTVWIQLVKDNVVGSSMDNNNQEIPENNINNRGVHIFQQWYTNVEPDLDPQYFVFDTLDQGLTF